MTHKSRNKSDVIYIFNYQSTRILLCGYLVWWWKHKYHFSMFNYRDFGEAQDSSFGQNVRLCLMHRRNK